jgi:tetratricopeptide (TPR) repeat protein/tRNA A-37 threonylcarbamoyl transferase component Bud32
MAPNLLSTWSIGAPASDGEREHLAKILDEYLQGLERGQPIAPEELFVRHPEVADRLRGYLSGLALFHNAVTNGSPPHSASLVSRGPELRGELGDFRLVGEIGRGGMGVVYEAEQVSLGRRVAIKVLPFSATIDEKQIMRFKNEAQAAAQIAHPHIVPVFAIGQEHGIHYFAMQLIGGQSLSGLLAQQRDEADAGRQTADALHGTVRPTDTRGHVKAIARIGAQVAEALHAAHEIGVVHRDVKPSNLLIDEKGKVWVTDFGVARCKTSSSLTKTGHLLGTMPYMSPEQALGEAALVDHRTDIYSLGVTLYELATLRHPFEGVPDAALAFEFGRSSLRPPRYWNSAIPVDFENIVLKAMAEARDERYATARELAEDLGRFLEGRSILARRPSLAARAGKWAARHKRSVAAVCGVLALAVSGLLVSLVVIAAERAKKDKALHAASANHVRAEKNYERAEAKFRQTREVLDRFGSRVNQLLANELPGAEGVRKELLAEMLPYYREFAREAADDSARQADLALTYTKIGDLSDQLGSQADAEQAYEDALAILEQLVRARPARPEHLRSLALCCNNLGQVLQKRGAVAEAREQLQRALAIQQQLVEGSPLSTEYRADLATTQSNLGLLLSQTGDKQHAAERYRAAIEIQESIRQTVPQDETNLNNLAASYNNLSSLYLVSQPAVARRWVEKAMSLQLSLAKDHPRKRDYQSDLALSYNNLGTIHSRLARWTDAEQCFVDAISLQGRLVAAAPLVTAYRRDLAVTFNNLGMTQTSARALAPAEASFGKALAIQKELVEAHPHDANLLSGLGGIYNNLGMVHQHDQQVTEACTAFQQAIATQQQAYERAPDVARFRESLSKHYYNYAEALRQLDRPTEAAAIVLARRRLWPGDADRLVRIAEELATTCKQMQPGELRQRYIHETRSTIEAAMKAGLQRMPDLNAGPFAVLSSDPTGAVVKSNTPPAGKAVVSDRVTEVQ